jgi:hypothetical protein
MSQLNDAIQIITEVLQLNVADGIGVVGGIEVKVSAADSKEIQAKIIDKFGCSKQTAYYYYFYRGKKFLTDQHKIVFVHDKAAPKRKKSAEDIVKDQIANLQKQGPASPFRL